MHSRDWEATQSLSEWGTALRLTPAVFPSAIPRNSVFMEGFGNILLKNASVYARVQRRPLLDLRTLY